MIPFYFGSSGRRLFGVHTPAERKRSPGRAIVLCYPLGREYLFAHRSVRRLGSMLSAAGFNVLRFDYFGTGDAAGDLPDATLAGWEADIEAAIEEIRDTTGATRVALAGLRLGGTLAARVAVRSRAVVQELVLWDPVVIGEDHLAELWNETPDPPSPAGHMTARDADAGGEHEVGGFPLTDTLTRDMRAVDLPALAPALPDRTLCIVSQVQPSHTGLSAALGRRAGGPLTLEYIPSVPAWVEPRRFGAGIVPVNLLQRIKEWLG
jgi:alpha-beta hydrolase superfamily lysophospholipase